MGSCLTEYGSTVQLFLFLSAYNPGKEKISPMGYQLFDQKVRWTSQNDNTRLSLLLEWDR